MNPEDPIQQSPDATSSTNSASLADASSASSPTEPASARSPRRGFGVDIGGSGVKAAIVDLDTGELLSERWKIETPKPATPDAVADVVRTLVDGAEWEGPVGITVPSVVRNQTALTAANIDAGWIGTDCQELFHRHLGDRPVAVLNDADAAGLAEVSFGDDRAREGSVLMLTFGTGIGSALLINGTLYPNTELGHLPYGTTEAEKWASSAVRERENLTYREWAARVSGVLRAYNTLLNPQTYIVGGGISRKADKWVPLLDIPQPVIPATLRNQAGIVGAALAVDTGIRP